jgi:hypothetical protein
LQDEWTRQYQVSALFDVACAVLPPTQLGEVGIRLQQITPKELQTLMAHFYHPLQHLRAKGVPAAGLYAMASNLLDRLMNRPH